MNLIHRHHARFHVLIDVAMEHPGTDFIGNFCEGGARDIINSARERKRAAAEKVRAHDELVARWRADPQYKHLTPPSDDYMRELLGVK